MGSIYKHQIFEFATSELSQDAFICWALAGLITQNVLYIKFKRALLS